MTADDEDNGGQRRRHAQRRRTGQRARRRHLHHVSSIAVAGEYKGMFREDMFDEGQKLPSPYHRTKFESERIVREQSNVPWRVYRPAVVVGDSQTGEMDKIDGPYYFFKAIQRARHALPEWVPLVGPDLGNTNVVPVDWVARAWTTSPTSPTSTARPSTSWPPRRSGRARCSTSSPAPRTRRGSR